MTKADLENDFTAIGWNCPVCHGRDPRARPPGGFHTVGTIARHLTVGGFFIRCHRWDGAKYVEPREHRADDETEAERAARWP